MGGNLDFGPVLITKGPYKGKIGYFDDDDFTNNNIIIYPDTPIYCTGFYRTKRSEATSVIPTERLAERLSEIEHELYKNSVKRHLLPEEEIALLHERTLCSNILTERYLRSMQKVQDQEKIEIFISHSSHDLLFSRAIATDLMEAGFSVFLDDWSINIGERIFDKISSGLQISRDYLKSVCCTDEWSAFYGKSLHDDSCKIYPIIIDDSQPPALISQVKYLRFDKNEYSSNLSALLKALSIMR